MAVGILHAHLVGETELKKLVGCVDEMCSPVAEGTHAIVIPAAPVALMILVGEAVICAGAGPRLPVDIGRHRLSTGHLQKL